MNEAAACCDPLNRKPKSPTVMFRIRQWLYLNIWCRHCYRHVMRFAHRYGWHYAPANPYLEPDKNLHWCQWCGLRGHTYKTSSNLHPEA